jgi:hypothetical protein
MELPLCAAFEKGECERSQIVVLGEADDHWIFGCRNCKSIRVVTKAYAAQQQRRDAQLRQHAAQQRLRPKRLHST